MNIDRYINEGQDPKIVEKLLLKLQDILTSGEVVTYVAVQKKPAVNLLPDSIALSTKRIFLSEFTKLGLANNFELFTWAEIKDIAFKEEIFGSKFTIVPIKGENLSVDYIPKNQARKLYQLANESMTKYKEDALKYEQPEEEPVLKAGEGEPEDELTLKLKKLKSLFERQLITQEEYESKKSELLSQL